MRGGAFGMCETRGYKSSYCLKWEEELNGVCVASGCNLISRGWLLLLRCSARGGGNRHKLPRDFHARKQTLKGNLQALVVFGSQDL